MSLSEPERSRMPTCEGVHAYVRGHRDHTSRQISGYCELAKQDVYCIVATVRPLLSGREQSTTFFLVDPAAHPDKIFRQDNDSTTDPNQKLRAGREATGGGLRFPRLRHEQIHQQERSDRHEV